MKFGNESGEVVTLTHQPPLPTGNIPGTHLHYGLSRPQDHGTVGRKYEGWNFNSGNYLFTTDTK